ncbi:MAG: hypothetical protein IKE01_00320 [Clostridia bacterium]|nr:hypothetical protein [Clostridia bacterium]
MSTLSTAAEKAANWWRNKLFVFSVCTEATSEDCPWISAFTPKSVEKGYELTSSVLEHFYNLLTGEILTALATDGEVTLKTIESGPVGLLSEISQAAEIPDDIFPANVTMHVDEYSVSINEKIIL